MTGFFKTIQIANGLASAPPMRKWADLDLCIKWYGAAPPLVPEKDKYAKTSPGELATRCATFVVHFVTFSACLSLILSSPDLFPFGTSGWGRQFGLLAQIWSVYIYLATILDVGGIVTALQGFTSIYAFDSPLLLSRSFKEAWGERWNMVVHGFLKSCVYKPLRSAGLGALPTTLLVFVASGLLHEYMFALHCASAYALGHVTLFFVLMGVVMLVEQRLVVPLVPPSLGKAAAFVPAPVVATILALLSCVLFDPLYMEPWRQSGMLQSMGELVLLVRC